MQSERLTDCFPKAQQQLLYRKACEARNHAHAPYSGFYVGAALLCSSGEIFLGCNVENASYPLCLCAERTALCAAIAAGERSFRALAICGGKGEEISVPCFPCGACRQVIAELCPPDLPIILSDGVYLAKDLLPYVFSLPKGEE